MKKYLLVLFCFISLLTVAQEPKIITDCTVTYEVSIEDTKASADIVKAMTGAVKVLYLRGSKSRSDLEAQGFKQTTLYDSKNDSTIVLRELGTAKYISYLNQNKRNEKSKKYSGIKFENTAEKKTILGYECTKVIAKVTDGSSYNVYYTPSMQPSNKDYEYQFKDLPGFVLEYEALSEDGKMRVKYSATKISLVPVPASKFDIPKSGYRVL